MKRKVAGILDSRHSGYSKCSLSDNSQNPKPKNWENYENTIQIKFREL